MIFNILNTRTRRTACLLLSLIILVIFIYIVRPYSPDYVLEHTTYIENFALSPNANTLATIDGDGILHLWDMALRQPYGAYRLSISYPYNLSWHSNNDYLVINDLRKLIVFDTSSQETIFQYALNTQLFGYVHWISKNVVAYIYTDPIYPYEIEISVFDIFSGEKLQHKTLKGRNLSWVNENMIYTDENNTLRIIDAITLKQQVFEGHINYITDAIYDDEQTIISTGEDQTIRFWNLETGQLSKQIDLTDIGISLSLNQDKLAIVVGINKRIEIYDINTHQLIQRLQDPIDITPTGKLIWSEDGNLLFSKGGLEPLDVNYICVWDVSSGRLLKIVQQDQDIHNLLLHNYMLLYNDNNIIKIWSLPNLLSYRLSDIYTGYRMYID